MQGRTIVRLTPRGDGLLQWPMFTTTDNVDLEDLHAQTHFGGGVWYEGEIHAKIAKVRLFGVVEVAVIPHFVSSIEIHCNATAKCGSSNTAMQWCEMFRTDDK